MVLLLNMLNIKNNNMTLLEQYEMLLANAEKLFTSCEKNIKNKELTKEGFRVISICKGFITSDEVSADDIYETVDSEDGYDIAEFGSQKGITEEEMYMWILLTDIVCVLCSLAYQMEHQSCVPQVIECIIEEGIEEFAVFINENMLINKKLKECVEYFADNVCY